MDQKSDGRNIKTEEGFSQGMAKAGIPEFLKLLPSSLCLF